jgi:hypothetical protein
LNCYRKNRKSDKHVINNKDVDEVVAVMGQQKIIELMTILTIQLRLKIFKSKRKKLYRDKDRGLIGGVCTG